MKSLVSTLLLAGCVCLLALPAFSQEPAAAPKIVDEFAATAQPTGYCDNGCVYQCQEPENIIRFGIPVWLPEFHGQATVRGVSAPVNVTTRDLFKLVDDIDMVVVGRLEMQSGRWGAFANGAYADITIGRDITERIDLSTGFKLTMVDAAISYRATDECGPTLFGHQWDTDLLLGARYLRLEADLGATFSGRFFTRSVDASGKRDWVDPFIGAQTRTVLNDDWGLYLRGDVGGFGIGEASQFTWNIEALLDYKWSDCTHILLGYRILDIDQRQGSGNNRFVYDVQMRGPMARIMFNF